MQQRFRKALAAGYERIVAWADIVDRINVYPVPDGDTGRNLVYTLSPLREVGKIPDACIQEILLSARGNSGNIAARFFSGFLDCRDLGSLPASVDRGRGLAYQAVAKPEPGTMLSLFDTLAESLKRTPPEDTGHWTESVIQDLEETVKATPQYLPELRKAGVVDAGALGMLVFFDSLLMILAGRAVRRSLIPDHLKDFLTISESWQEREYQGFCLDVVLKVKDENQEAVKHILKVGDSMVAMAAGNCLKVHLHATDRERSKSDLSSFGSILRWAEDDLAEQTMRFAESRKNQAIHIMTDAAGSITRDLAQNLGVSLLNSYITMGDHSLPETYVDPSHLFSAMKSGVKVSTSQASEAERYECYHNVMKFHDRVLYLCVGSFYTGNYDTVMKWKGENDPEDRMTVIDTGVASGKLGLVVRAAAQLSLVARDASEVILFAEEAVRNVQEYIFLDRLQFLAAGGRMSKTGAFFGDVLGIKPIVSPFPDGARKMGVVRNAKDQIKFALSRLKHDLASDQKSTLLLEYSDNRKWVEEEIKPEIERQFPLADVFLQILSLTSAAHMGPGSWGIALLPESPCKKG
jgi:DegV family protein with EDD domain